LGVQPSGAILTMTTDDYHVSFTEDELAKGKVLYNFTEMPVPAGTTGTEMPGLSSFRKDDAGDIFHTYSSYARGGEELIGTSGVNGILTALMILDRAPKGRNEKTTMDFVHRHDEYEKAPKLHDCCA
jgi:predicted dithiol-disulfide oxidoreductase (DUF899 family)